MEKDSRLTIGIVGGLVACLCLCVVAISAGLYLTMANASPMMATFEAQITEVGIGPATAAPTPNVVRTPIPTPLPGSDETLKVLQEEIVPQSDVRLLAMRLLGIPDIPETVSEAATDYDLGHELEFNVSNTDTNDNFKVTAELRYKRENIYFFVEKGVRADDGDIQALVDTFQDSIYPTDREFFGSEWNPGVDGDPRLYVLYVRGLGFSVAGYYSSADEYSRLAHEFSNEKEMFYINADNTPLDDEYVYGTLAHEFQHMIHWYHDRNEESWMNEGASELAQLLNDYDTGGSEYAYVSDPDLQLNTWSAPGTDDFGSHYGAAFMFMAYFLDRFGNEMSQALVAHPANGMQAVEDVLAEHEVIDPLTEEPITAKDVFADWVIANYLGDKGVGDGRYEYYEFGSAPTISDPTKTYRECPVDMVSANVAQYGADYYRFRCAGEITLSFVGSQQVRVIPAEPHSGRYAFWGNRNDESNTTLTREFDLTDVNEATLNFWMWHLIEKDFDFVYLVVSDDDGETWDIIKTPSGSGDDPTGNNFGWGYTAASGGGDPEKGADGEWVEESVDLSEYAGKKILVSFEYVTDAALNYPGFMIDDVSIPEIDYSTDFETDDGGWNGEGFVRMDNLLPQQFIVQVIKLADRAEDTTIERMALDAANQGSLTVTLEDGQEAILVISGVTPFTTEPASYQFEAK